MARRATGGEPRRECLDRRFWEPLGKVANGEPLAIAQLGLLVLLATPIARVAVSVVAFALERDRIYTAITLAVLAILLASVFLLR